MKIRQIKFNNINNLKGAHEINFNDAPLSTAGIFAITGPTGSGKSSILDVITLALFNKVPRFKRAISKGEIQGLGSILTHHTTEAEASIEYEIKGQTYTSFWSVAKTRKGTLKDYEMSLMDSSGCYLDLKRSEVPARNEEIIGLKYDQFVKSIILSQGQFSRFLKADKNERGQLLENLTGTSVYRKIGIQAFQKFRASSEEAKLEKEKLEDIELLSEEAKEAIKQTIEAAEKEIGSLNKQLERQDALIAVKSDLQEIARLQAQNTTEKEQLDRQFAMAQPEEARLTKHEKLSGLQGDLRLYDKAKKDIGQVNDQLSHTKDQQIAAQERAEILLKEISELTGQTTSKEEAVGQLNQFENEVTALDRVKTEKRQQGIDQRAVVNQKAQQYHLTIQERIAPGEAMTLLTQDREALMARVKAASLSPDDSIPASRQMLKAKQESYGMLKELSQVLSEVEKHARSIGDDQEKLEATNQQLVTLQPLIEQSEKLIAQLREKELLLRKQKEDAIKIAELESLRPDLEDGKPCPLCGAVHHPYAAHAPEDQRSLIDESIAQAQRDLQIESTKLDSEKEKRTTWKADQQHLESSLKKQQLLLAEQNAHVADIKKRYVGEEDLSLSALHSRLPELMAENQALDQAIEALEQLRINTELIEGFKRFLQISEEYLLADKKRSERYTGNDIKAYAEQFRRQFQLAQDRSLQFSTQLVNLERQLTESTQDLNALSEKLSQAATAEGFSSIEELGAQLLPEAEVLRIRKNRETLQKALAANEANSKSLTERKAKQEARDSEPGSNLQDLMSAKAQTQERHSQLNVSLGTNRERIDQDDKNQLKLASKAETLEKLEAEVKKWSLLNKMIGDANGHKFSNFAQGITLQNLLAYANKRLQKLSDRYLLIKPEDEGSLKVLDQYQGNSERSVTTLSGGETFLLSLALALGLSDMASKNVSLDSLFIDEGFGTLDQETLDIAMNTLERLQSESQKTVGVISHVEALKERITVQVRLQKDALGYSKIKVD